MGGILPLNTQVRVIGGVEYTLTRKKVKNINLRIKDDGLVFVSAPMRCSLSQIERFILQKENWILKAQQKVKQNYVKQNEQCTITKKQALEIFTNVSNVVFPYFYNELNGVKPLLKVRDMKTRWGVCKPQAKVITLNLRLAQKPMPAIEYVVLHEYVHFIARGHGKDFYAVLSKFMPDYKKRRALLK